MLMGASQTSEQTKQEKQEKDIPSATTVFLAHLPWRKEALQDRKQIKHQAAVADLEAPTNSLRRFSHPNLASLAFLAKHQSAVGHLVAHVSESSQPDLNEPSQLQDEVFDCNLNS